MADAHIEKSFCTTREAASLLGVSVGTVQLWVENGLLQAWKTTGGHRRVLRDSLERLLHNKAVKTSADADAPLAPLPRRLSVLVVEDDPNLLRLYHAHLSTWPLPPEVTVIGSAVAALLQIVRKCPDLLVTDLQMPDMDGFNMLRVLRDTPEVANITIVVVSALDATDIAERGGIAPEIEVLPKPIPFERLRAIAMGVMARQSFQTSRG